MEIRDIYNDETPLGHELDENDDALEFEEDSFNEDEEEDFDEEDEEC